MYSKMEYLYESHSYAAHSHIEFRLSIQSQVLGKQQQTAGEHHYNIKYERYRKSKIAYHSPRHR